ncbi:helix-turn-helix domain-containing protein [Microbacterium rhizosphaerae]|uniref:Helix-turn-helix domain-containing protein n=1 Tax=Microbacterium rhizosphaerae TaxID=1678237 RepID=A0ABZ0SKF4_9MICO|nr:helix-turn-helix domain-containing protein [Microbacterium rhizosphaerae]WPR88731.1 helix-turn-helix domain-containing protein [Microbacterium rhizosphaerae]
MVKGTEHRRSGASTPSPRTGDLDLGRRIAARREDLGMSRKDLASATELSYPYIAQIETGYRLPSSKHQPMFARVLGMSLDELFGTVESAPPLRAEHPITGAPRPSREEAIERAVRELETLPASVRLEALAQVQMKVMAGIVEDRSRTR